MNTMPIARRMAELDKECHMLDLLEQAYGTESPEAEEQAKYVNRLVVELVADGYLCACCKQEIIDLEDAEDGEGGKWHTSCVVNAEA